MGKQGRTPKDILDQRLEDTELHLIRLRSVVRVEKALAAKYDVTRRTVRRWIKQVRKRWAETSASDTLETRMQRRSDYRATLDEILAHAMTRTKPKRDARNKVVKDAAGNVVMVPDPDTNSALRIIRQLRELDGIDVAPTSNVNMGGAISLTDLSALARDEWKD